MESGHEWQRTNNSSVTYTPEINNENLIKRAGLAGGGKGGEKETAAGGVVLSNMKRQEKWESASRTENRQVGGSMERRSGKNEGAPIRGRMVTNRGVFCSIWSEKISTERKEKKKKSMKRDAKVAPRETPAKYGSASGVHHYKVRLKGTAGSKGQDRRQGRMTAV